MDLSKKLTLGAAASLFLSVLTYIVFWLMKLNANEVSVKTSQVFILIFALASLAITAGTAFIMHRDSELETISIIALSAIALVAILLIASSSLTIDIINNLTMSESADKASMNIPFAATIFALPAFGIVGFSVAR